MSSLVSYLESKGVLAIGNPSSDGNQCMSPCPHCGVESTSSNQRFWANDKFGHCFKCGAGGNIYTYQKIYGDFVSPVEREVQSSKKTSWVRVGEEIDLVEAIPEMVIPEDVVKVSVKFLWGNSKIARKAKQYLKHERGFKESVLKYWKIGLVAKKWCEECEAYRIPVKGKCPKCREELQGDAKYFISLPFFDRNKELVCIKYRTFFGVKQYMREKGSVTSLYGLDKLGNSKGAVYVTEAELDALAVYQFGKENVVSIAGSENWEEQWRKEFANYDTVYLVMDQDNAGLKAVRRLAEELGAFRCKYVQWPKGIKDAAQFLEEGGSAEEFDDLVRGSSTLSAKMWLRAGDMEAELDRYFEKAETEGPGYSTGHSYLDELIGGIRMGEFTIITADTGHGKSMFTADLALNLARSGLPTGVASFELTKLAVLLRSISQDSGIPYKELKKNKPLVKSAMHALDTQPYHILKLHGEVPLDELEQALQWGYIHYGVKVVVLDHLHYFVPGMNSRNERFMLNDAVKTINGWVEDWGIHIILVVHPSKLGGDYKQRYGRRIDMDMLRGAAAIKQEAHNVWSLYRAEGYEYVLSAKGEYNQGATELWNQKCRSPEGRLGRVWFKFDMDTLRYTSVDKKQGEAIQLLDSRGIQRLKDLNKPNAGVDVDTPEETEPETEVGEETTTF